MITAGGDVEHGVEVGCLAGTGQHSGAAAFHGCDLGGYHVAGGILQARVEIAGGFQVKKLAHILAGCVLKSSALDDGHLPGLAVAGGVACLDGQGFHVKFLIHFGSPQV